MSIWFKHDAHFHEHPKCLKLRRLAGQKSADSAEIGWWRIVAAAKRVGDWQFEDEEHLKDAAGRYYNFVGMYREVGLLDGLTIHNGAEYQSSLSGAERVARYRRNAAPVTPDVTEVTPRESRESRESRAARYVTNDDDPEWLTAWHVGGQRRHKPTEGQRVVIDAYLRAFDATGPARLAQLFWRHPDNPIGAAKDDLAAFRAERTEAAKAAEVPKAKPRRGPSMPESSRELLAYWAKAKEDEGAA